MTTVPPAGAPGGPSKSEKSDEPSHKKKAKKSFSLPKVHGKEEKEPQKKLEKKEEGVGEKGIGPQMQGAGTPQKSEGAAGVSKVNDIIVKVISDLYSGTLGSKQITSMNLKATSDLPTAFQGTSLTIVQTQAGLVVNFSNFNTTKQMADAITLVQQNQQQLAELVRVLSAKNISIAEFQVGNTVIALPKTETTGGLNLTPLRAGETEETRFRRREGGEERGGGGEQQREPGERR